MDDINPNYYKKDSGLETIFVIKEFTENLNGFEGACTANILKYACRWKEKNGIEDVKKIKKYAEMLISYLEDNFNNEYGAHTIRTETITYSYPDDIIKMNNRYIMKDIIRRTSII